MSIVVHNLFGFDILGRKIKVGTFNEFVPPVSLEITGDWANTQYAGLPIDYTGLTFIATDRDGTSATVTPTSIIPSVWGSSAGTQTVTFNYTEGDVTVSASKSATIELPIPVSLSITGDWTNIQRVNVAPDITGLTFTCNYSDGGSASVVATLSSPSTWGNTVGTQTATFSYTEGAVTLTATKDANVIDNYENITATDSDVLYGKRFLTSSGTYSEGTMINNGAISATIDGLTDVSYTIPSGYHNGSGTVSLDNSIDILMNQILGEEESVSALSSPSVQNGNSVSNDLSASDVLEGKTFINDSGNLTSGSMTNRGAVSASIDGIDVLSYTVPGGYHNGSGVVSLSNDIDTELESLLGKCVNSLSISGNWTNTQYVDSAVDYTGLTFTVTYNDGTTATVTPTSISPSTWGSTVGTQTCTFTYEENGFSVSASKSADVQAAIPVSLSITGDWSNTQYTREVVDYTGLVFIVTYSDGNSSVVTPTSLSPSTWSSTVGTQSCTFSYTESGITVSASKSASVQNAVDPILDNNDWATIKKIADAGTASQYWSVGDYKEVSVAAGTVDQMSVAAGTYRAVIIGINHNPTYENPNSIDFAIGQNISGTDICFYNSTGVRMNTSDITTGGWTGSQMYLTYLPQLYSLLSGNTGLQSAMIAPKKYTNNVSGGSAANIEANVTLSEDANYKMFLLAEYEIFGTRTYANSYEQNKQSQYYYYSSSGLAKSKIRYRTDTGAAYYWWERSAYCLGTPTSYFCDVDSYGGAHTKRAGSTYGLCPCFRV